jgi:hypothetical protein
LTDDEISNVHKFLRDKVQFFETYQVTEFVGYRRAKDGHTQKVNVQILDAGEAAGDIRYHCHAQSDDGKRASGNAADRPDTVLAIVHWYDLDK